MATPLTTEPLRVRCLGFSRSHAGVAVTGIGTILLLQGCFNPSDAGPPPTTTMDASGTSSSPQTGTNATADPGTSDDTESSTTRFPATTDGTSTSTSTHGDSGTTGGQLRCDDGQICIPAAPEGWTGPVVLGSPNAPCPRDYPSADGLLHQELLAGTYQCGCSCNVGQVSCHLIAENVGEEFRPAGPCAEPPSEDECISAQAQSTCLPGAINIPAAPTWGHSVQLCTAVEAPGECLAGSCYPAPTGPVCLFAAGDQVCPEGFNDRALYHRDFVDTRSCSPCNCTATGQACRIAVEICSVGFFDVTLHSDDGCFQQNQNQPKNHSSFAHCGW